LRTIGLAILLVAAMTLLNHCKGHDNAATSSTSAAAVATTSAGAGGGSVGFDPIGVPECDSYMKKYMECVTSKVPEASRAQYRASLDQLQQAWLKAASTPEGKQGLAIGCKAARSTAEQVMKAYGCTF